MLARSRVVPVLVLAIALLAAPRAARAHGDLTATANAISATEIEIVWQWYEYPPGDPAGHPEWVGYDLYRRNPAECSPWVRLNAEILPRVPGATHGGTILDAPPATLVTWQYELRPVDADRNEVYLIGGYCEPPCAANVWESIPKLAGPVTVGTIGMDLGWALYITPCPDGCWYSFYIDGQSEAADALRPYLGTGQAFEFYGDELYFGGFEGSSLGLDRYEPTLCDATPAARPSWGRLKTLYR